MITELITNLAAQLVARNASWLSEIRTLGYLNSTEEGKFVTDFKDEIGLTDREGNSGYIRFQEGENFSTQEVPRYTSCSSSTRYVFRLRLVIAAKTESPENLALLLSTQINSLEFLDKTVHARVQSGGSNSPQIVQAEGGEQLNNEFRVVYVNFNLQFDWRKDCDTIPIIMSCSNCTSTIDLGCRQHCDAVPTFTPATETATYTLNTFFNGVVVTQSFPVTEGADISVPMAGLNESYEYDIQVRNSDGEIVELKLEDDPSALNYDCFRVKLLP